MTQPDDATLKALIRMAAPRKALPLSFKAKKGGGIVTLKGRF